MEIVKYSEYEEFFKPNNVIYSGLESNCYLIGDTIYKIYKESFRKNIEKYRRDKYCKIMLLEQSLGGSEHMILPHVILEGNNKGEALGVGARFIPNALKLQDYILLDNPRIVKCMYEKYFGLVSLLHASHWYWGDGTPSNVIVAENGTLYLIDLDSAGNELYKNDCTNMLANRYLITLGIATKEILKNYWCKNTLYDELTMNLSYMYQLYGKNYITMLERPTELEKSEYIVYEKIKATTKHLQLDLS